jgi:hypothetical protein
MLLPAPGRALHEQWCLPWPIVDTGTDNSRFASQIKPQNVRPNMEKTPFLGVSEWSVRGCGSCDPSIESSCGVLENRYADELNFC